MVIEIFWKKLFLKKVCQMLRFPKTSWLGLNNVVYLFFLLLLGNVVSSGQHRRGNVSAKSGVRGCFPHISNPCISKTVGHIKTNMELLGRRRPHFWIFDVRKKRRKNNWFDRNYILMPLGLEKFSGEPRRLTLRSDYCRK